MKNYQFCLALLFSIVTLSISAQTNFKEDIKTALALEESLSESDVSDIEITTNFVSKHNGVHHVYGTQNVNGIPIANSNFSAAFNKDGELVHVAHRFYGQVHNKGAVATAKIDEQSALYAALGNQIPGLSISHQNSDYVLSDGIGYTHTTTCDLVYFMNPEMELILTWNFNVDMPTKDHWWNFLVDANTGDIVRKTDWQVSCKNQGAHIHSHSCGQLPIAEEASMPPTEDGSNYRVYEFPVESPNHGERTLAVEPANEISSPFGWHDLDGISGADYNYTRGNNVYAYDDVNDSDNPGTSPNGGGDLIFDYPYISVNGPDAYIDASLTNLFYATNRIHDLLFIYGFDEASGNFQARNHTGLGEGFDALNAEGQDGGGTNNANMATPPEGNAPRMQMYLWSGEDEAVDFLEVNTPSGIAGGYTSSDVSAFGPDIPVEGITADMAIGDDGQGLDVNDLCEETINGGDLLGKIVLVNRGGCNFSDKVIAAMDAGAVACIVINNGPGFINMGGTPATDITIPSIMISQADGALLMAELTSGETVNATLMGNDESSIRDGSFDNGIVAHEYVHGLSTRLTGGAYNTDCLFNEEQMGEGWSDWYASMLTMNMDVDNPVYRPMGTYASGEPTNGNGIRPAPYDTSFAVNDYTYADIANANIAAPHGVGFVWCTMLWDLTWALMDEYGYEDIETGTTGGNNIAMQLVTDGLKLQECSPGFVDGRDAILLADELNNDGANQCLIWKVFAKRGLGFSAEQGSTNSKTDGVEAFDIPPFCQVAVNAPSADFEANTTNTCFGLVQFTDLSTDTPQSWFWEFGDGATSDEQNPTHQYAGPGVYTVSLTVTNTLGEDIATQVDLIEFTVLESPSVTNGTGCEGETVTLSASTDLGQIAWLDNADNILQIGDTYDVVLGANDQTVYAQAVDYIGPDFVGPATGDIGSGGNHGSDFVGTVDFEAHSPLTIESAWINSGGEGIRIVNLWDEASGAGNLLAQIPVLIDFVGEGRVDLGIEITAPGTYSIGLNEANLYRNDGGVNYPYIGSEGLMDIVGSSAGPDFYYYFYDLEVSALLCQSESVPVVATVSGSANFEFETDELTCQFTDLSGNTGGWNWNFGDGNTSTEQNPVHTYAEQGVYTVTLIFELGCSYSMDVEVIVSGLAEARAGGIITMPVPANTELRILDTTRKHELAFAKMIDLQGRVVKSERLGMNAEHTINVSDLSNGFYLLVLENIHAEPIFQQKISIVH